MKGEEVIQHTGNLIRQATLDSEVSDLTTTAHIKLLEIHSRALACHCECLGMNAENSWAVCANTTPPYNSGHYAEVMQKWGLINEKGEPLI